MRTETIGAATLYLADCRDVLPTLAPVDAVVTDPPYGTENAGGGYGRRQNYDIGDGRGRVISNDADLSVVADVWPMLSRIVPLGWVLAFYSPRMTPEFCAATAALPWFGGLTWFKRQPGLGRTIRYNHEAVAVFRQGDAPTPPAAIFSTLHGFCAPVDHPHLRPVDVLAEMVTFAARAGQSVLDPFMGTGTTGVACAKLGRRFVGVEIEPKYFDMACRRIEAAGRHADLFVTA